MTTPTVTLDELQEAIRRVENSVTIYKTSHSVIDFVSSVGNKALVEKAKKTHREIQDGAQQDLERLNEVFSKYWIERQNIVWED